MQNNTKQINWGILSFARIARRRVIPALIENVNNGKLYAIATQNPEKHEQIKQLFNPEKIYSNYQDLLDDPKVDAVYIPLPNSMHVEWAIKAMRAGKHVLCEKPIALDLAQLDELEKTSRETNMLIMEAFACLHSPLYPTIKKLISDGEIGKIRLINASFHFLGASDNNAIYQKKALGGGAMYDIGCYNISGIRQIAGCEPKSIIAMGEKNQDGVDISSNAILSFDDGLNAVSECSINAARRCETTILGETGFISFNRTPNAWGEIHITLNNQDKNNIITLDVKNTYALELEQLGDCILNGATPLVSMNESRKNLTVMLDILNQLNY